MPGRRHCRECGAIIPAGEQGHRRFWCATCLSAKRKRENLSGPTHYKWSGGRHPDERGYIRVTVAPGQRRLEHTLVWEQHHGPVPRGHHVHHRDGDKGNNAIENLELLTNSEHQHLHKGTRRPYRPTDRSVRMAAGAWSWAHDACVGCGTTAVPHKSRGLCNHCNDKRRRGYPYP